MNLFQDVRFALRTVRKRPTFAAVIVLTLALCIGANTAIFSVVDAALLRPLPYPHSDRLVQVAMFIRSPRGETTRLSHDGRTWEGLREQLHLSDLAVFSNSASNVNFAHRSNVGLVRQQRVSAGFFGRLDVAPLVGREFSLVEDRPGGAEVAILSYDFWKRIWQEDSSVIGQSILLRGQPHSVVGVMPPGFRSSVDVDLWTPLRATSSGEGSGTNFEILGRLREGTTRARADQELASVGRGLLEEMNIPPDVQVRLGFQDLHQALTRDFRTPLTLLWGAVGAVLVIGCVNIAGMLLARGVSRSREIGTRIAMGGRVPAIIRQLLTEGLVYALLGGLAGLGVARVGIQVLKTLAEDTFPFLGTVALDGRVALATALFSLLACLGFGVFPAIQATRIDVNAALGGSGRVAGPRSYRSMRFMVLGQIALAVPLVIAASLLVRTFVHLWHLSPGFDASKVLAVTVSFQDARYQTANQVNRFVRESLSQLDALPAVESAAVGLSLPYEHGLNMPFHLLGGEDEMLLTTLTYVSADYFQALRIPLLRGRAFDETDRSDGAPTVVVSQAFAERYLQNRDPLATELRIGTEVGMREAPWRIVGVVGDVQQRPTWGTAAPLASLPAAYIPITQTDDGFLNLVHSWFSPSFIVRTAGPTPGLASTFKEVLASVDPLLPVASFRSLADIKSQSLALQRFLMTLLAAFAGLAAVLAVVGVYGVVANAVAQRGRELCVRMAIGATATQAILVAMLPGLRLAMVGSILGLAFSFVSARMLEHLVWGVQTTDPATLAGVVLGAVLLGALASMVPALRVVTMSPADKLRE